MEIRDTRNGEWYWVNTAVNACNHISHSDKSVYGALASFSGFKEIRPSFKIIAKRSATSLRQAKLSIKKLIKVGYIEIVRGGGRGNANVYNLTKCPKGCKNCTVSKGCNKSKETVQELHLNGAKSAPHIDKDRYIRKKEFSSSFKKKPTYQGQDMRSSKGKWWVLPKDGGEWLEFALKEKDIEWI